MLSRRALRIAMMLESDGPGGAEVMVLRLAEELRKRGHFVLPIGPSQRTGWLAEQFRRVGFNPEVYNLRWPIDPGGVRDLLRLFTRYRIDVVHSHEFTMAVYGAAASRLVEVPQIITMHGGLTVCKALRRRIALRWAMRQSSHTVMVSNATRAQFVDELGVDESSFSVVPNGVPVRSGVADGVRQEFGVLPDECVFLAVGNLELHKGHHLLLEALRSIRDRAPAARWRLIIAGGRGGARRETLNDYVRQHELDSRVNIVLNRQDIPDLLASADVFVMPSLWEGLPLALLEAMVARKAIVASATAGIPEAISNGQEGILVQPGDVPALTNALQLMIENPRLRVAYAEAAWERASRNFTAQVMAERYESLYVSALSSNRAEQVA